MDGPSELSLKSHILGRVLAYWRDVDTAWGANAHNFFIEDGVFQSENVTLKGRGEIKAFYDWRRGRGERVARHLVNNAEVTVEGAERAAIRYVMTIYAADGVPVLPVSAPNLISDVTEIFVRTGDAWLIESKTFSGLFKGEVPATIMPREVLQAVRDGRST